DLTSTYFACDPPETGKRRFGHSRDHRSDCVQVVIALIVTPEGFPLTYEVMPGNTSDKTTLGDFLRRIEVQYGKAGRTWVMDRGIPTEAVLTEMRAAKTPTHYLVGTPRARLSQLEQEFLARPWAQVRDSVQVKLIEQDGELYILARSGGRRDKEQAMRRRRLKKLVKRLHELRQQKLTRDQLLIKLGAARTEAGPVAYRIIDIQLPGKDQPVTAETFCFKLNWQKLREARRREGSYLLRSNLTVGVGEDGRNPDGRHAPADHRWAHRPAVALHRARTGPVDPAPPVEDRLARSAVTQDCLGRRCRAMTPPCVVPTFRPFAAENLE